MKLLLVLLGMFSLNSCINKYEPAKNVVVTVIDNNKIDKGDLSYLRVTMLTQGYELSILDKYLKTDNIESVDQFMNDNIDIINSEKIAVRGFKAKSDQLQKLTPVLKKYKIEKFRIENI